jgi:Sporulation delaying protein SdpA
MAGDERAAVRQGFGLTVTFLGTLLVVTCCAQLPAGWAPSWLAAQRTTYRAIWPQHWGFFAALPDSVAVSADRPGGGERPGTPLLAPQMSAANAWGLGRTSTVRFDEVRALAGQIPARDWTRCPTARRGPCRPRTPVTRLRNRFTPAIVCGEVEFVRTRPATTAPPPAAVALAEVVCR